MHVLYNRLFLRSEILVNSAKKSDAQIEFANIYVYLRVPHVVTHVHAGVHMCTSNCLPGWNGEI